MTIPQLLSVPAVTTLVGRLASRGAAVAGTVVSSTVSTTTTALGLLPRVALLLDRVELVVERIEAVSGSAEDAAARTHAVLDGADASVARTNAAMGAAEASLRQAQQMLNAGNALMQRADAMVTQFEQPLTKLLPSLQKFSDTLEPREVEAAISLIDQLPALLGHVEDDLLPMLQTLDRVGPDVHEILEIVEDLRRVVTGLPGMGLLRKRADDEPQVAVESGDGAEPAKRRPRRAGTTSRS